MKVTTDLEKGTQRLRLKNGDSEQLAVLKGWCSKKSSHLELSYSDQVLARSGWFFWDAFNSLRLELESSDVFPICYGTCLDMHPTGLDLDWSGGLNTNKLILGEPLSHDKKLFYIFDTEDNLVPSTAEEQRGYFQEWEASIKN